MDIAIGSLIEGARQATGAVAIIDVFRAFTTAAVAFANGAARIIMVGSVEEALALREIHERAVPEPALRHRDFECLRAGAAGRCDGDEGGENGGCGPHGVPPVCIFLVLQEATRDRLGEIRLGPFGTKPLVATLTRLSVYHGFAMTIQLPQKSVR